MGTLKRIHFIKITLVCLGPVIALVIFFLSYYAKLWGDKSLFESSLPSFALAMLGYLLTDRIATQLDFYEIKANYKSVTEMLKSRLDVVEFSSQENAINYIISKLELREISEVRNTSINHKSEEREADLNLYDQTPYRKLYEIALEQCSRKELIWTDVAGVSAKNRLDYFKNKYVSDIKYYSVRYITELAPQINFILLKDRKTNAFEVLFNWDHRGNNHTPHVMLSRDTHIVNMFLVHHNLLFDTEASVNLGDSSI